VSVRTRADWLNEIVAAGEPPVVLIDFDGVIHHYEKWDGPVARGRLIAGVEDGLTRLRLAGVSLEIYSTRPRRNVLEFLRAHNLDEHFDRVRDGKPYYVAFFDDRAHHVRPNAPDGLSTAVARWLETTQ